MYISLVKVRKFAYIPSSRLLGEESMGLIHTSSEPFSLDVSSFVDLWIE